MAIPSFDKHINKQALILAIESSCDDTSAAVLRGDVMLSNVMAGQQIHAEYGGVVPELASRAHQSNIVPVVQGALKKAKVESKDLNAIAVTMGPGLMGSLLVGASFAKSMSQSLGIPLISVNHMKAHIMAHFIQKEAEFKKVPEFPFLCLTVSGGHTQLVLLESPFELKVIGQTIDDAAGEAFDKAAKLLGLPYPGGPLVDKYAKEGNRNKFEFPIPKIQGLDYSFSGLKTSLMYFIQKNERNNERFKEENLRDVCASYQDTIVRFLLQKLKRAAKETGVKHIALAGGVSANSQLRNDIVALGKKEGLEVYIPEFQFCTDNAAMIAMEGQLSLNNQDYAKLSDAPKARFQGM